MTRRSAGEPPPSSAPGGVLRGLPKHENTKSRALAAGKNTKTRKQKDLAWRQSAPAPLRSTVRQVRTGMKGIMHGFSTIHRTYTPVHARLTQIRAGFADGFAEDTRDLHGYAHDSRTGSRRIREIRNGLAGFATESHIPLRASQYRKQQRQVGVATLHATVLVNPQQLA